MNAYVNNQPFERLGGRRALRCVVARNKATEIWEDLQKEIITGEEATAFFKCLAHRYDVVVFEDFFQGHEVFVENQMQGLDICLN